MNHPASTTSFRLLQFRLRALLTLVAVICLVQLACTSDANAQCGNCPSWCECINGVCQPTSPQVNAVRLRTPDGRYLRAVNGGKAGLVATAVAPAQSETFRLAQPTTWPLASLDRIVLEVCEANWDLSGFKVRVDVTRSTGQLWSYQFGGPGAGVYVRDCCVSSAGYAGWTGEWTFFIEKVGGGPIATGDQVSLATSDGFYFRTTSPQDGALVDADGTPGQAGTLFVVEFNQVIVGLGWRPSVIQCQTCGTVTGTVTDAAMGRPIDGATVEAQGINFKAPTMPDATRTHGRFTLKNPDGRVCVPEGPRTLVTSANYYQTAHNSVTVPVGGITDVPIQLNCTEVSGKVIDDAGHPVQGATVFLVDVVDPFNSIPIPRPPPNSGLIQATTGADGTFVIHCVPHGNWGVWTTEANVKLISVPPEGLVNVLLTVALLNCGNVVGDVKDADTGLPIVVAGVTPRVALFATQIGVTAKPDGTFRIECVLPTGTRFLLTAMAGYLLNTDSVNVPASGDSAPVHIKLHSKPAATEITIVLTWGTEPHDLDAHLSGPGGLGGRFHLYYLNRTTPPVDFATLSADIFTGQGPETITVGKSLSTGMFVAGEYHYWVHNYSHWFHDQTERTFNGSGAVVKVFQNGVILGEFDAVNATIDPANNIWHVVNLQIDANGGVVLNSIQIFKPGDPSTKP